MIAQKLQEEIEEERREAQANRQAWLREKELDRQKEVEIARINVIPDKVRASLGRWNIFFNAPARFVAVIISYKLLKRGIEVPEWLQNFIV
jgi:hypothetical protein